MLELLHLAQEGGPPAQTSRTSMSVHAGVPTVVHMRRSQAHGSRRARSVGWRCTAAGIVSCSTGPVCTSCSASCCCSQGPLSRARYRLGCSDERKGVWGQAEGTSSCGTLAHTGNMQETVLRVRVRWCSVSQTNALSEMVKCKVNILVVNSHVLQKD